jgi:nitrogen fixation NifU-like protein
MSELKALYQNVILDHNKNPRNFRIPEKSNLQAEGYNPVCGDQLVVYVDLENDVIKDIGFQGSGCAISKSSASLMTESIKGKNKKEAQALYTTIKRLLTEDIQSEELGNLAALSGVREFPVRVKCATLAWETLNNALEEKAETASTE